LIAPASLAPGSLPANKAIYPRLYPTRNVSHQDAPHEKAVSAPYQALSVSPGTTFGYGRSKLIDFRLDSQPFQTGMPESNYSLSRAAQRSTQARMKPHKNSTLLFVTSALAILSLVVGQAPCAAQQPAAPAAKESPRGALIDLVVRDKKGRFITDLKPSSVVVNDNGSKQAIAEFRLIQGGEAVGPDGSKVALDALHQVRLVTLVFETMADADLRSAARNDSVGLQSMSQTDQPGSARGANSGAEADRRRTAQKATLELLKDARPANVYYSVVALNTQLLVLQPFTQDTAALAKAVERATSGIGASDLTPDSKRMKVELRRFVSEHGHLESGANTPTFVQTALAQTMLDMSKSTTSNAGGPRLTIDALQSLSRGLSGMPGRKTILYFTPGLQLPTFLDIAFTNLKGLANRANVAIYSIDTRGPGQNESGSDQLNSALAAAASSDIRVAMHASDSVESAGRANVQLPIRELAEDTGGFLIAESNNLAGALRRAVEEVNNYYEIAYDPGITEYDGSFRKIKVEIARKDAVAHARSGYLSLAPDVRASSSVQPFELPLLKALSGGLANGVANNAVEYRADAVLLQPKGEVTDLSVLLEIPLHVLQPKPDAAKNTISISFALAALVKDSAGETVQKLTREHSLQVTAEQMKAGNFIEKLAATVPAGKYALDSAVMDRVSGKIGTQRSEFAVPPKSKGVAISSLTPVRSYAPSARGLSPDEPFQFQGGTITPMLSNSVIRSEQGVLPLFFTVYPDPALAPKCTVDIEFFQNGQRLQKGTLPLPEPDQQGRIPYVFSVPASIQPGSYEIHATAHQGDTSAEAKTMIKVESK
jgi:VWFA-related protein